MTRHRNASIPPDMKALGQRIDLWRKTRQKRGPMPAELWDSAIALAEKYGVYSTARGLPVDFGGLKRRCDQSAEVSRTAIQTCETSSLGTPSRESSETYQFVEIDAAQVMEMPSSSKVSVELSAPDGATMTVRLEGGAGVDVIGLAGAFWKRGS